MPSGGNDEAVHGSAWKSPGRCDASIAIPGVICASLMLGPARNLANQVLGSGPHTTEGGRFGRGLLSKPISHAEAVETNMPSAKPA